MIYGKPDKGINIYDYCENYYCIVCNKEVVVHIKNNYFDLLYEKNNLKYFKNLIKVYVHHFH